MAFNSSARVAKGGRDRVDRQMDAFVDPYILLPGAIAFQKLDLQEIQRFDVGEAQADRSIQPRIIFEQAFLESRIVISNHLLESLDKIRLPTGRKHGSALQRRSPWPSSFMDAHRHNHSIRTK